MTQEDKQLLLQDLCARIPYGVKAILSEYHIDEFPYNGTYCDKVINLGICEGTINLLNHIEKYGVKPYLRPMSSMTNDERKYIEDKCAFTTIGPIGGKFCLAMPVVATEWLTDFYNSHYLDWRGLIQMGLAIEASKGMYNIKEEK